MLSTNYAYVNGRFLPESRAAVSIFDRGFLFGDGCFETMRVYGGKIFRFWEHVERLTEGLAALQIESPLSPEEWHAVYRALVKFNDVKDGVARIYRTRDSIVATVRPREFSPVTLRAIVSKVPVHPVLAAHKTANRLPYILAKQEAEKAGVEEAVLVNGDGKLVEFSAANLFIVKNGELFTPPLQDGVLPGITRAAVLMLAQARKIKVNEQSLRETDLAAADEVFATNSLIEIAPITNWGKRSTITKQLQRAYQQLMAEEL